MADRAPLPRWLDGLGPGDFLFNGTRCTPEQWDRLDWSRAYADVGPSLIGNLGPYWHVPWDEDDDELWARLYPKVLRGKWLLLIRRAIAEAVSNAAKGDDVEHILRILTDA
jgi:hypothetical protein